jgi:hypothetical protein
MKEEAKILQEVEITGKTIGETGSKYDTPEITAYILDGKTKGKSFSEITQGLKDRGFDKIAPQTVSDLYARAIAKATVVHNQASDDFEEYQEIIKQQYGESINLMGEYVKLLRNLLKDMKERYANSEDEDKLSARGELVKSIPYATNIMKEIREYAKLQMELGDKVYLERSKEVWNEGEIMDYVNKYLKTLEKNGQVRILDPCLR